MPKLSEFPSASKVWQKQLLAVGVKSISTAMNEGADFMREAITDSPTGHSWHLRKNAANGFPDGARIGNANSSFGEVDPNSGNMLNSVSTVGPSASGQGDSVVGFFGWMDATENNDSFYFAAQDAGNYDVGKQKGMGLLNGPTEGSSVLREFGAQVVAEESLIKTLTAAGLKLTGRTGTSTF